jgi:hypothetical protein
VASTVILREFTDVSGRRMGGPGAVGTLVRRTLVTDAAGKAIKTVTTILGTAVDSIPLSPKTHFVEIEGTVPLRYAVRPKNAPAISVPATARHNLIPANTPTIIPVYPSAIISFLE